MDSFLCWHLQNVGNKHPYMISYFFLFAHSLIWLLDRLSISQFSSVQSLSRVWLFATPWTTACQASLVHHQIPEFTQTHAHRVGDAIQPSHPLLSPSPPGPIPSQHQGLFQWVNSSHEVAKVLEFQLQHQPFQWTPRTLGWTGWISLQCKGLSRVFSDTTVQKHQFFGAQLSSQSNSYPYIIQTPRVLLFI